jgi:glycosyltransferase involved in cell wall biosynthesis
MASILHIIHELSLGGAARSMAATAKYSARTSGHRHTVLSLQPPQPGSLDLIRDAGMRVVSGSSLDLAHAEMAAADIVQIHWWNVPEMYVLMTSRLPETRMMLFYHVAGDGVPHIITPFLAEFADLNVPCNPYSYRELSVFSRMDKDMRREKVAMVYDAADFERLKGLEKRPHKGFNIGYIGTVDFVKMHPRFVEMSLQIGIEEARFIVCGEGGALETLRSKASAAGQLARFDFRGYVNDIRAVISDLDVYGYPLCEDTYAAAELNLQEIMFAGIPPVVFPYGGVKSLVINDFTGMVVHSESEYAQAIEHLLRNPTERRRLGENAAEYARQIFGAENASVKMDALYSGMLRKPKRNRIWSGPMRGGTDGSGIFLDTISGFDGAFLSSRDSYDLSEALRADAAIASSSRLAFLSGIMAYRGRFPNDPFLRYWAGLVFESLGSHAEAAMEFVEAIKAGFPHWRAQWRLMRAAAAVGRPDLAETVKGQLEARHPGYLAELEAAGREAPPPPASAAEIRHPPAPAAFPVAGKDWSAATGSAARTPTSDPEPAPDPIVAKAEADFHAGRVEEAERALADFAASHPGNARAYNSLGVIQHSRGRKDQARRNFLEAVKADMAYADALLNLADSLVEAGLHAEALGLCYRCLDFKPHDDGLLRAAAGVEEDWADRLIAKSLVRDLNHRKRAYKVTALVSTYKSAAFMRECLEDLEGQTIARDLEIVIVDADSPEGESAIVEEFQRRFDNIRYIRTPERIGIYPAWNLAIRAASGDFLTPMSTNDRLAPDAYERLIQALEANPDAGLAYGDSYLTNIPHQEYGRHTPSPDYGGEFRWPDYSFEDLLVNCRVGPHPLWRRSVHAGVGYFDGRYKAIGDQDFWLRLALKHPLVHIPVFTGLAWITKDSLSGQSSSMQEIFDIHNKHTIAHLNRLKKSSPVPVLRGS